MAKYLRNVLDPRPVTISLAARFPNTRTGSSQKGSFIPKGQIMASKTQRMLDHGQTKSGMERRLFLGTAGVLTAGLTHAQPVVRRKIRSLMAEGIETPDTVIGRQPLMLPPELVAALSQSRSPLLSFRT
jgi:hypothetical protein